MRLSAVQILLLILFVTVISSCSRTETGWKGTIEEENGITVVKNPNEPLYMDYSIEFVEDLSIGVEEGNEGYMFFTPRAVDADSEGNIYILEYGASRIRKYGPDGQYLMDIARKGQGPGELEFPMFFTIDAQDNVNVVDIRRIEVLDSNGLYQKTLKFDFSMVQIASDITGDFIISYRGYMEREGAVEEFEKISIFSPESQNLKDFYAQERMTFRTVQGDDLYFEFPYFVRWDKDSVGNIYAATATDYTIHVFSSAGELLFRFDREFDPLPVESDIRKKVIESLSTATLPRSVSESREYRTYLNFYPVFKTISVDEKDRIWVENYYPRVPGEPRQISTFDVFSSDGKYLFQAKIGFNVYPRLIFKNGFIYVLVLEESGFSRALRLRIVEN